MKNKKIIKITIITIMILLIIVLMFLLMLIKTYSLDTISYKSLIYKIEEDYIENISPNTPINLYKKYFDLENCFIEVVDENNNKIQTEYIYNGSKTIIYDNSSNIIKSYTNIITGDIKPDGKINNDDIIELAKYLIKKPDKKAYETIAMDINNNNEIKVSDLILLKDTLENGYQSLSLNNENIILMTNENERLIPNISPNKILNQNLTWTSSDESIAMIDESGLITPKQEGETTIAATTKDGKLTTNITVIIDNTIRLSETEKTAYVGGNNATIDIKAVEYNGLVCESSDNNIATCEIKDKKLIVTPLKEGETKIKVISSKYKEVTLNLKVLETYFTIFPKADCMPINRTGKGIISSFFAGTIEVTKITDKQIIKNAYIGEDGFYVTTGEKTGTAQVTFKENNGNKEAILTLDVFNLKIPDIGGIGYANGEEFSSEIIAENTGELTCKSRDETIATCKIVDNKVTVTPLAEGTVYMDITGTKCGSTTYLAVIKSEVTE